MYPSNARLGFWSALLAAIAWLVFTVCFVVILVVKPLFTWTNLDSFLAHTRAHDQTLAYVAQACMLLWGPIWVVVLSALQDYAAPAHKGLAHAALVLGIGFAVLTGINYFTQITAVRSNIARGTTAGLEHMVELRQI
ncbi:MAG: hypothetical protein M1546_00015 [Chloroflexi bacterium]|nr:hypothetical protein [Chloroflexota bacterium]